MSALLWVVQHDQILGTFAKSGYANTEILYKFFYYWLSPYWNACEEHIKLIQASSPMTWEDAEWLYERLAFSTKRTTLDR